MKLLVTGKPKSGKSTLLHNVLSDHMPKQGLLTNEVTNNGKRMGFELQDATGRTAALAQKETPTDFKVGPFYVDIAALNTFITPLFTFDPKELLYIDEIGQMQLASSSFRKLVDTYMNSPNTVLGTISKIYDSEYIDSIRNDPCVIICEIGPDTRVDAEKGIAAALGSASLLDALPKSRYEKTIALARAYAQDQNYVSFYKLFNNALPYVTEGRITEQSPAHYVVTGNTNNHNVLLNSDETWACDCPLFTGQGQFAGHPGECSHIQSAMLLRL